MKHLSIQEPKFILCQNQVSWIGYHNAMMIESCTEHRDEIIQQTKWYEKDHNLPFWTWVEKLNDELRQVPRRCNRYDFPQ